MATAGRELDGYVGFANLPNQVFRKSVKRGFDFTLMVVGRSGLGKSTLVNSLFLTDLYCDSVYPDPSERIPKTTEIQSSTVEIKEGGVRLRLTVVDTPGFGDLVNNSECWEPIIRHVDAQFEDYLNAESRVNRGVLTDSRIHCCLYFIPPSGHGLKPLDVEFMKQLHQKVNIIPVIAKADTFTPEECAAFKKKVLKDIEDNKIKIYDFPDLEGDDEEIAANKLLKESIPFAVVGSLSSTSDDKGKRVRGRRYPWGVAEVENLDHCDFTTLRNMLIRTHMQDLKDVTNDTHYENYRAQRLANVISPERHTLPARNPMAQIEFERQEHEAKMRKMEEEMQQVFAQKVMEKEHKLRESEADLQRRHEQMMTQLEKQQHDLDEKRRQFEQDKAEFQAQQRRYQQEQEAQQAQRAQHGKNDKTKTHKRGLFT
jgi:septin 7